MNNPNSKEINSEKLSQLLDAYCFGKGIILADLSRQDIQEDTLQML